MAVVDRRANARVKKRNLAESIRSCLHDYGEFSAALREQEMVRETRLWQECTPVLQDLGKPGLRKHSRIDSFLFILLRFEPRTTTLLRHSMFPPSPNFSPSAVNYYRIKALLARG